MPLSDWIARRLLQSSSNDDLQSDQEQYDSNFWDWLSLICVCPTPLPNTISDEEVTALFASEHTITSSHPMTMQSRTEHSANTDDQPLSQPSKTEHTISTRKQDVSSPSSLTSAEHFFLASRDQTSAPNCLSSFAAISSNNFPNNIVLGTAFDLIVIRSTEFTRSTVDHESTSHVACSDAIYSFDMTAKNFTAASRHPAIIASSSHPENGRPKSSGEQRSKSRSESQSQSKPSSNSSKYQVVLEVDTASGSCLRFPVDPVTHTLQSPNTLEAPEDYRSIPVSPCSIEERGSTSGSSDGDLEDILQGEIDKEEGTFSHCPTAMSKMAASLSEGRNRARYLLLFEEDVGDDTNDYYTTSTPGNSVVVGVAPIHIYLWNDQDKVIVVDVDGTVTKSNIRGVVDTVLTAQYQYCHDGVCEFFSSLLVSNETNGGASANNLHNQTDGKSNVRVVYLSSRPIALANTTRKFLSEVRQQPTPASAPQGNNPRGLPEGAFIGFHGSLTQLLIMELLTQSVHEFKSQTLLNQVIRPFVECRKRNSMTSLTTGATEGPLEPERITNDILLAGFGNTVMDIQAYHMAGLRLESIYLIDKKSRIYCLDSDGEGQASGDRKNQTITSPNNSLQSSSTNPNSKPVEPKARHEYMQRRGSSFEGYQDSNLLPHVLNG